jgi:outer membrane protein TolC
MKKTPLALAMLALVSAPAARAADRAPRALSFDESVKLAVANNPTATTALTEVHRLEAVVRETRAASLPTLSFNMNYTLLDSDRTLPSSTTVIAAQDQLAGNFLVTAPLVSPANWAKWSHATDNVQVGRRAFADAKRTVAVAAARAYLTVFALKRLLDVSIIARDNAKAHADFAHTRVQGGVGTTLDEARADTQLSTSEVQVQAATIALDRARESLGVILGLDEPVDVKGEPPLESRLSLTDALRTATSERTDVRLARSRLDAAWHVERDSWTDFMPLLGVVFEPFYQNPPTLVYPTTGWQLEALLTIPLYDGGLRYGERRERTALTSEAKIGLDATLRQASSDVRVAFDEVHTADAALKAANDAARAANHALDLANLAYKAGATTNLDVIDAERQARDAATQATIAEDGARQARLDLLAASGKFP